MLIVVAGLPGSGKSFFADHLAEALGIPHFKSDDVRDTIDKRGAYDPGSKAAVYEALIEKALENHDGNPAVIIDATFHKKWMREMADEKARKHQIAPVYIRLTADDATIRERVEKPRPDSDADFAVYRQLKAEADPLKAPHLLLDSGQQNLQGMLAQAYAFLNLEPA